MEIHTETQHTLILRIREYLAGLAPNELASISDIERHLKDSCTLEVKAAIARMLGAELVMKVVVNTTPHYARTGAFVSRHIIPLFNGTPEWIVESYDGRLVCWCPSEFDARVIADALKRS